MVYIRGLSATIILSASILVTILSLSTVNCSPSIIEETLRDKPELAKQLEHLKETRAVSFLITGKTGTGKSTLINGLVGKEVAKVGDSLDPETMKVKGYPVKMHDITFKIYDSPGLQDGLKNEVEYLKDIERTCKGVDLILYTIKMTETRLDESETGAMHKLTCAFGAEFWDHTIIMLTFANMVQDPSTMYSNDSDRLLVEFFEKKMNTWKKKLPEILKEMQSKRCSNGDTINIPPATINRIPILPAGYPKQPHLPGHEYWFSKIWETSILLLDDEAKVLMLKANEDRIKPVALVSRADFNQELHMQPIVIRESNSFRKSVVAGAGAVIGGAVGGPIGALVGSILGAFFG